MKCTIQNIADHLGLSRNTVSKALQMFINSIQRNFQNINKKGAVK